jgi:RNase H-fold protein (predicted Holliday junction resolvase)|uniref:C-terminal helicase domain-containing protein n=1 Tax=Cylindrospermopsis raciborskii TaxID=77022 RepID=UPI001F1A9218|nr:C-terminal helicase domain-containing protein [Cylindrospermopsis raciborskii]
MVNYDLPWNPNRLEQRFGRIHRIGQTEVCHLWNLVAHETREGDVYRTLLEKLEAEQKALGGQVFDVLGKAIAGKELRELLIEAIRYGDRPEVKARLNEVVKEKLDQQQLLKRGAILIDENDYTEEIRALVYLEHAIQDARLNRDGKRRVVSKRMQYVEIPLRVNKQNEDSKENQVKNAGYAPYLNYRPLKENEKSLVDPILDSLQIENNIEKKAIEYAITNLVVAHLQEIKQRKEELIEKTMKAVKDRLTKEINYWDYRASQLRLQEEAGKPNARLNSNKAQARADELESRLNQRLKDLQQEKQLLEQLVLEETGMV